MCSMASIASCQPPDLHHQSAAAVPAALTCAKLSGIIPCDSVMMLVMTHTMMVTTHTLNPRPGMQRNHKGGKCPTSSALSSKESAQICNEQLIAYMHAHPSVITALGRAILWVSRPSTPTQVQRIQYSLNN